MEVHRSRFLPYPASTINVVAFSTSYVCRVARRPGNSHSSGVLTFTRTVSRKGDIVRLAIGRADGSLEIWDPQGGTWHQELVIPGGDGRSIEGLVWTKEPNEECDGLTISGKLRLFSIGYTQTVTEWDLANQRGRHAGGQHGDIWCIAAQPLPSPGQKSSGRKLVAGTVDGCLVLFSIEHDNLEMQRILTKTSSKKVKMVTATFQSRQVVIVGCSDSTIRAYDIRNGSVLHQMTLGSDLSGGPKDIIVWAVKCLEGGDIVSGDSTGQVCIWDGRTYTQAQRIQSHTQDVLSLATSADGKKIVSGGMDRRTVLYEPMRGQKRRWAKVWHRRYHNHDVKTLASFEGKGISVVVSGGPDATPVVLPLRGAGKEHHRTLSHLPQNTPVLGAPSSRLVFSWWAREIHVWQILQTAGELLHSAALEVPKNYRHLAKILIKGEANISSAAISRDGSLLVVATPAALKAFQLRIVQRNSKDELVIKMATVKGLPEGAAKIEISPDTRWLCATGQGSRVSVAKISSTPTAEGISRSVEEFKRLQRLPRNIPKHIALGGLGAYNRTVNQVAFSPDSKMLATCDLAGFVDTWVLGGHTQANEANGANDDTSDDSEEEHGGDTGWIRNPKASLMPKLSAAVALSFSNHMPGVHMPGVGEQDDYNLLVVTASSCVYLFNPLRGALSDWSRRNPSAQFPQKFRVIMDLVKGVFWQGPRAWFYGVSFLFMLDLSRDLEPEEAVKSGTKRKREDPGTGAGGKMKKHARAPAKVRSLKSVEGGGIWVDVDVADGDGQETNGLDQDDDEDDEDIGGGELQSMRDAEGPAEGPAEGTAKGTAEGTAEGKAKGKAKGGGSKRSWHTFKYRPILGIVSLQKGSARGSLEVVIVERPLWDVKLPDRYVADGEYER